MNDSLLFCLAGMGIYLLASRLAMRWLRGGLRELAMALLNLAGVYACFFYDRENLRESRIFAYYVALAVFQYLTLRCFSESKGALRWLAFSTPLAILIATRYVPHGAETALGHLFGKKLLGLPNVIGLSYLAFRCSHLVLEVQNGSAKKPGLCEYLNFAFFLPTMSVGPINTYANHRRGFAATPWQVPVGRAALRIVVGWVKYQFLGGIFSRLAYQSLLLNGHFHHWHELPIAMAFYYLYLYCNFSGFCDLAIGAAALIGIPVLENFHNPFAARNLKDFWNRWHITLSQWMRDIVFAPLSKFLVRRLGPSHANHAIAIAIAVVFLLVGLWHGAGWNFVLFGAVHAGGLVANHYYTIYLKKKLGRDGFKAYLENHWIHAGAVILTFTYCATSLLFFANTLSQIHEIFKILR